MTDPPQTDAEAASNGSASPPSRSRKAVSRAMGLAVSGAVASLVFAVGVILLPSLASRPRAGAIGASDAATPGPSNLATPPPPRSPAAAPGPAPGSPTTARAVVTPSSPDASPRASRAVDAALDGSDLLTAAKPAATARVVATDAKPAGEQAATAAESDPFEHRHDGKSDGGAGHGGASAAVSENEVIPSTSADGKENPDPPDCSLADKDIAREAWRRNWPTLCTGPEQTSSLFVPIKGTLEGETHDVRRHSNWDIRIHLPAGESLLTMRQYKVRRGGFAELRVVAPDDHVKGARFRLKLQPGAGEPVIELKDGYAKITITPSARSTAD